MIVRQRQDSLNFKLEKFIRRTDCSKFRIVGEQSKNLITVIAEKSGKVFVNSASFTARKKLEEKWLSVHESKLQRKNEENSYEYDESNLQLGY